MGLTDNLRELRYEQRLYKIAIKSRNHSQSTTLGIVLTSPVVLKLIKTKKFCMNESRFL